MGYCTSYKLKYEVIEEDLNLSDKIEELRKKAEELGLGGVEISQTNIKDRVQTYLELDKNNSCGTPLINNLDIGLVKWYYEEEDMLKLSKLFSSVLFTLSGKGEESGDVWKKYYLLSSPHTENHSPDAVN